jgi:hypothetical protein
LHGIFPTLLVLTLRTYDISTNVASPEALPSDHYG